MKPRIFCLRPSMPGVAADIPIGMQGAVVAGGASIAIELLAHNPGGAAGAGTTAAAPAAGGAYTRKFLQSYEVNVGNNIDATM